MGAPLQCGCPQGLRLEGGIGLRAGILNMSHQNNVTVSKAKGGD